MRQNEEDQGARILHAMSCVLLGGAVALLLCFVFLLICSAAVSRGILGEGTMTQMTVCACVAGAFVGGLIAVRQMRARALIVGICTGAVLFLLLLTVGVLFYGGAAPAENGLMLAAGALIGGALAGLLGRTGRKKRRK